MRMSDRPKNTYTQVILRHGVKRTRDTRSNGCAETPESLANQTRPRRGRISIAGWFEATERAAVVSIRRGREEDEFYCRPDKG